MKKYHTPYYNGNPDVDARKKYYAPSVDDDSISMTLATEVILDDEPVNLVSSICEFDERIHLPLFDLDNVEVNLYSSSSHSHEEPHLHLYINHPVRWEDYVELLQAMVKCGIVDKYWVEHCIRQGHCTLRLPYMSKPENYARRDY